MGGVSCDLAIEWRVAWPTPVIRPVKLKRDLMTLGLIGVNVLEAVDLWISFCSAELVGNR